MGIGSLQGSQDDLKVQLRLRTTLPEAIVTQPNPETDVEGPTQVAEKLPNHCLGAQGLKAEPHALESLLSMWLMSFKLWLLGE